MDVVRLQIRFRPNRNRPHRDGRMRLFNEILSPLSRFSGSISLYKIKYNFQTVVGSKIDVATAKCRIRSESRVAVGFRRSRDISGFEFMW